MALRKNQPQTRWVVAQRRQPSSVSNVWPSFIAISAWGGSSCEKTSCTKTAYCISNDMLTQLALLTVVNNELGKPNAWVLTNLCSAVQDCIDQEFIQDLIGDTIQWFDYNDALNQWLLENPFPIPYTLTSSWNSITLTIAWNPAQTATLVLSNSLTNTGLVITSSVNWVVSNTDITSAVQSLIDANTDSVTNTITGNRIATHIAVDNTSVDINETVTTLSNITNGYRYTNESWVQTDVIYDVIDTSTPNPKLTITVWWVLVKTIDLNQNDIQINNAGSDFDLTDDIISFVETNWDTATISFAKYNVTVKVQPNWDQLIYQNGNLIATIPNTASWISIVDVGNYYTSSDVEWALQEIGLALNNTCSWNPLSPTNKLITTDSLTTNATLPANITWTPDTTDANNVFLKAEKRLSTTWCLEDVYVPSQIFTQRQLLTPTAIVTANPLAPTLINSASKDYYRSTVSYTVSVPTGWNYIVDVNACNHTTLIRHNSSWSILWRMVFWMLSFFWNWSDHYPWDIERITWASNVNAWTLSILGWASFSCVHQIDAVVDTWIALLTTTWVIVLPTQYCVATFYPSN